MNKPTRTAIILSAVISLGTGQFVQHRWIAGTVYLIAFLICIVFFLVEIIRPMATNILISIDLAANKSDAALVNFRVGQILIWFGLSLAVYLASLLDTTAAYYRQCRQWAQQRLPLMPAAPSRNS